FALGIDIGQRDLYGVELILADAPVEDLFSALVGIQDPTLAFLNQGNGIGPFALAHFDDPAFAFADDADLLVIGRQKPLTPLLVRHRIAGRQQFFGLGTVDRQELLLVVVPGGGYSGFHRLFGGRETLLLC